MLHSICQCMRIPCEQGSVLWFVRGAYLSVNPVNDRVRLNFLALGKTTQYSCHSCSFSEASEKHKTFIQVEERRGKKIAYTHLFITNMSWGATFCHAPCHLGIYSPAGQSHKQAITDVGRHTWKFNPIYQGQGEDSQRNYQLSWDLRMYRNQWTKCPGSIQLGGGSLFWREGGTFVKSS